MPLPLIMGRYFAAIPRKRPIRTSTAILIKKKDPYNHSEEALADNVGRGGV
jgi:hypothetical protein